MSCLDDDQVLRAVGGGLAADELAALDAHLDGCPACRALIGAGATARGAGAAASDELRAGDEVGRYRIEHRLGAGAMGVVYAARDPELDRTVALKLMRPERGDDRRLLREAQAMARLGHPNIVAVHDVGTRAGQVYVAMERVDGPTLRTWAATRPFPAVRDALLAIGRGLAAAHAAGVIHRDVKPDNVLVGADGRPRIGDFGMASTADDGRGARLDDVAVATTLTATGAVLGTPLYMAPEQLRGAPASPATDTWSFAVMGWELLLGGRPFAGADLAALARAIAAGPPAVAARGEAAATVAPLTRALALDPADRYPSLDALLAALAPAPPRRRARWIAAVLVATLAVGATLAIARDRTRADRTDACAVAGAQIEMAWSTRRPERALAPPAVRATLDRVALRWRSARIAVCRAAATEGDALAAVRARCLASRADELAAVVGAIDAGADPGGLAGALAGLADPDECATSTALALLAPVPPEQRGAVAALQARLAALRVQAALGERGPALVEADALVAAADRSGHRPTQAAAHLARAEILRGLGRYDDADAAALAAALDAAAGHDDATAARAWLVRVGIAGDRRDLVHAAEWLPHADAAVERAGRPALLDAQLANSAGLLALDQGRLDEAAAALGHALAARRAIAGADVEVARTLSALGHVARQRGDLAAALADHQAALAIDRAALGPAHPDVGRDLHNLGGVLRLQGALDRAEAAYREALAIRTAALGERHPEVGLTHNSLGLIALERGQLADAERELTTALTIFTAAGHGDRAIALANLARVAEARGDAPAALALADQAVVLDRAQLPARHARLADNLRLAAHAAAKIGDRQRAAALDREASAASPDPSTATATAPVTAPPAPATAPPAAVDAGPPPHPGVYGSAQGWN